MTLGKTNCREGLNGCMNYEFNLLHHVGVVAKRLRAAAADTGPRGNDYFSLIVSLYNTYILILVLSGLNSDSYFGR